MTQTFLNTDKNNHNLQSIRDEDYSRNCEYYYKVQRDAIETLKSRFRERHWFVAPSMWR